MATCPRCLGALTENHRCPRSTWLNRVMDLLTTIVIGSVVGAIVVLAVEEQPSSAFLLASALLGTVLTGALRQAIGKH
jgi:hypothetical protein